MKIRRIKCFARRIKSSIFILLAKHFDSKNLHSEESKIERILIERRKVLCPFLLRTTKPSFFQLFSLLRRNPYKMTKYRVGEDVRVVEGTDLESLCKFILPRVRIPLLPKSHEVFKANTNLT